MQNALDMNMEPNGKSRVAALEGPCATAARDDNRGYPTP